MIPEHHSILAIATTLSELEKGRDGDKRAKCEKN
jgi:hypothetical protein